MRKEGAGRNRLHLKVAQVSHVQGKGHTARDEAGSGAGWKRLGPKVRGQQEGSRAVGGSKRAQSGQQQWELSGVPASRELRDGSRGLNLGGPFSLKVLTLRYLVPLLLSLRCLL